MGDFSTWTVGRDNGDGSVTIVEITCTDDGDYNERIVETYNLEEVTA